MNAWDHLPNAKLIDWAIADMSANPSAWITAMDFVGRAREAYQFARDVVLAAEQHPDRKAAWWAAFDAVRKVKYGVSQNIAGDAIAALIAYDDCPKYLDMTPDELRVWAELSNDPSCILLLPMVIRMREGFP